MNKEQCNILLIDNDSDWFDLYKNIFIFSTNYSFIFHEATDFSSAKHLIASSQYDLAVVDYLLDHSHIAKSRLYWKLLYQDLRINNIPIIVASEYFEIDALISMINNFNIDAVIDKNKSTDIDKSFIDSILKLKKLSNVLEKKIDVVEFSKLLDEKFELVDLNTIMFRLHIDSENIAGSVKRDKIINLIKYCEKYNLLLELVKIAKEVNPFVFDI